MADVLKVYQGAARSRIPAGLPGRRLRGCAFNRSIHNRDAMTVIKR
jgi:hypothetical protein